MSTYRVLISCPLIKDNIHDYADEFDAHDIEYDVADVDQQLTASELLDVIDRYDGVLAGDDEFTSEVIESADSLTVISKWGIGIDAIDTQAAEDNDVTIHNTPGAFNNEVADVVTGYAIMLTRELHHVDSSVRNGDWVCPRGVSLAGKTFGVIGVGDIGSTVARRADALGMNVLGADIQPLPDDLVADTGIEHVDREELLRRADVVSLNCALTPETQSMIGETELELLGPNSYLINTARGKLVDQDALVEALEKDAIAGAALDVFEEEPLSEDDPLTELDSVILGSHNAQNTEEAVSRVNDLAVENLISGLVEDYSLSSR
ncbi:phosphoglycerate dehydrogenase [Halobacterium bonnevillei]|uniref:Dihydrofolate reductase n=1 Tax=Halobacterium bonnevillei TaxID=2692200 RepID=A0A6B0SS00_9EURY|nr:phosphoglycerate dehydrogenase [Halobacterium bonnevillei]MXR21802.1 dihydrofolate reductase [Halobacterium bonnevillei]